MMKLGESSLNGIKKYIFPVVGIENANFIALSQKVGTACENSEESGIAHFLEHIQMSFDFGRKTGFECFASTDFYSTTYYFNVDLRELETVVEIIENIIHGVYLNNENMERARKEVLDEYICYNEKNRDTDFKYLLKETEYIEKLPIGKSSLIEQFTLDDVKLFLEKNYVLQNMCIIWIVDEEVLRKKGEQWIEKLDGRLMKKEEIVIPYNSEPKRSLKVKRKKHEITYYLHVQRKKESIDEVLLAVIEGYLADCFQIDIKISKVILSFKDEFIKVSIKNGNDIDINTCLEWIEEDEIQKKYKEFWQEDIIGYNCNQLRQQLVNSFIFDLAIQTEPTEDIREKFQIVKKIFQSSEIETVEL